MEDYISVKEASERYGLSGAWLRRLLERVDLKGRKIGNSRMLLAHETFIIHGIIGHGQRMKGHTR